MADKKKWCVYCHITMNRALYDDANHLAMLSITLIRKQGKHFHTIDVGPCRECGCAEKLHGVDDWGWSFCDGTDDQGYGCNCGNNIGR